MPRSVRRPILKRERRGPGDATDDSPANPAVDASTDAGFEPPRTILAEAPRKLDPVWTRQPLWAQHCPHERSGFAGTSCG